MKAASRWPRSYGPKLLAMAAPSAVVSTPQPVDLPAIALGRITFPRPFEMHHRFTLISQLESQLPARLRLAVQRLRNRRRTAHVTEQQNFQLKVSAVTLHMQPVAGPDLA